MSVKLAFRLGVQARPLGFARTVARFAVNQYRDATPVRSGDMRDAWYAAIHRTASERIILGVFNDVSYAGDVFEKQAGRFRAIPGRIANYARRLGT